MGVAEEVGEEEEEAEEAVQGEVQSQEMALALVHFSSETPAALSLQKTGRRYCSSFFGHRLDQEC